MRGGSSVGVGATVRDTTVVAPVLLGGGTAMGTFARAGDVGGFSSTAFGSSTALGSSTAFGAERVPLNIANAPNSTIPETTPMTSGRRRPGAEGAASVLSLGKGSAVLSGDDDVGAGFSRPAARPSPAAWTRLNSSRFSR